MSEEQTVVLEDKMGMREEEKDAGRRGNVREINETEEGQNRQTGEEGKDRTGRDYGKEGRMED